MTVKEGVFIGVEIKEILNLPSKEVGHKSKIVIWLFHESKRMTQLTNGPSPARKTSGAHFGYNILPLACWQVGLLVCLKHRAIHE